MDQINQDNWSFTGYKSSELRAFIFFGANPASNDQDIEMLYFVTLLEGEENKEVFQTEFKELDQAIADINRRYGHWEFNNRTESSGGGCGSCEAH